MSLIHIGIDPGYDGSVSVVWGNGQVSFYDPPVLETKKGKKKKRDYDIDSVFEYLAAFNPAEVRVVLEKVGAFAPAGRKQGGSSMFSFGQGFMLWRALLAATKLPHKLVPPQTWKKAVGISGRDKKYAAVKAMEIFPLLDLIPPRCRVPHIGRADAFLMSRHCATLPDKEFKYL